MTTDLRGRSYLSELDFTAAEIHHLLDLAAELKAAKRSGTEQPRLTGKHLALIFEKTSTRTRCAFEVAAADQGAATTYLGPGDTHVGSKESIADTARVLGRMFDAIEYRGSAQSIVTELAARSGVPVYNGLTDTAHPTQSLCDVLTMHEHSPKPLQEISYCYLGDARNNMGNSLLSMGALLGMDVRIAAPKALWPEPELVGSCRALGEGSGARITLTEDVETAVRGADFLHTDVWVSMGEPADTWRERIELLAPYQVNAKTLALTGNPDVRFMHCLPALHDHSTRLGRELLDTYGLDGLEVTDEIFSSAASVVFDQAENRLHTIKAVLVATLQD
ncbi:MULTISPECIES: ornithine carbamoyltransferase [unclassified Streptomyces]|uniref:ornithine carbamoyltransferase n=1 Tax=unclassified Streptomyces TaxID=2593676 RepID=UPI0011650420|nr:MULTISPECIES: ornithine carbamoyltransferase [unclassified Streptomyces]NMI55034.1 ornithine carbamoyltransferase [Streptomyces sp. RLA2-12]QDN62464.1 ornithine carbamoyltransferase [Streptomyces sp. S1D4-20]QDN72515.1 ornithine carbamoyltransferase [Streptomyces sp. S1D4-14]QDN82817.1 ornithine carbamoyltransferase [Streptomyces sp. S1A1-7]QDO55043.1 ornithine carbamoyltransferase [Streptomyces sp. RLB3-5]